MSCVLCCGYKRDRLWVPAGRGDSVAVSVAASFPVSLAHPWSVLERRWATEPHALPGVVGGARRAEGGRVQQGPDFENPLPGAVGLTPLSSPLCPAGSACCCWCALPRPGSCGASSTPSCGTGGNTGPSRAPSGEAQRPPDYRQGSSRGSLVSARQWWSLSRWWEGARAGLLGLYPDQPCSPPLDSFPEPGAPAWA